MEWKADPLLGSRSSASLWKGFTSVFPTAPLLLLFAEVSSTSSPSLAPGNSSGWFQGLQQNYCVFSWSLDPPARFKNFSHPCLHSDPLHFVVSPKLMSEPSVTLPLGPLGASGSPPVGTPASKLSEPHSKKLHPTVLVERPGSHSPLPGLRWEACGQRPYAPSLLGVPRD